MSKESRTDPPVADTQSYRLFIERQWADIHHSRLQEWTALGVVTGAHVGILQFVKMLAGQTIGPSIRWLIAGGAGVGIFFAFVGFLVTLRHRHLMFVKLSWIYAAEKALGLVNTAENPGGIVPENVKMDRRAEWKGLRWPRFLSTSFLILCFYGLLGIIDFVAILFSVSQ